MGRGRSTPLFICLMVAMAPYTCLSHKLGGRSYGCVFAELLLGQPLFPGESNVDQLVEIIKVYILPPISCCRDRFPVEVDRFVPRNRRVNLRKDWQPLFPGESTVDQLVEIIKVYFASQSSFSLES